MPTVHPLSSLHEKQHFDCGKPSLNAFLRQFVTQYEKKRVGRTFVLVEPPAKEVFGYYTLASGAVRLEELPEGQAKKLPRHPVPVIRLARLAVDQRFHGKGFGALLLRDALTRSLSLSDQLGVFAVVVDALDEEAATFYAKYSFMPTTSDPLQLFLPMETFAKTPSNS